MSRKEVNNLMAATTKPLTSKTVEAGHFVAMWAEAGFRHDVSFHKEDSDLCITVDKYTTLIGRCKGNLEK